MRTRLLLLVGLLCLLGAPYGVAAPVKPAKPELLVQTGHVEVATVAAFSPDERLLATGSNDGTVKLWDVVTARMITTITPDIIVSASNDRVVGVAFTPDGKTLFTSTDGGFVQRWDVPTGARRDTFLVNKDHHAVPFALSPEASRCTSFWTECTSTTWRVAARWPRCPSPTRSAPRFSSSTTGASSSAGRRASSSPGTSPPVPALPE